MGTNRLKAKEEKSHTRRRLAYAIKIVNERPDDGPVGKIQGYGAGKENGGLAEPEQTITFATQGTFAES